MKFYEEINREYIPYRIATKSGSASYIAISVVVLYRIVKGITSARYDMCIAIYL